MHGELLHYRDIAHKRVVSEDRRVCRSLTMTESDARNHTKLFTTIDMADLVLTGNGD